MLGKAIEAGRMRVGLVNPRDFMTGTARVDDTPYGGGAGVGDEVGTLLAAIESLREGGAAPAILMSPRGRVSIRPW